MVALLNLEHFPLVVSLQEAHAGSTLLSLNWVLPGEKIKASRRGLCVKLQKGWPTANNEIDKIEELVSLENSPRWITLVRTCQ
jgi:hypothetical protein